MRITKDQKAITLIALVITIIVLLILAGVALATLTGNGNIIDNANNAVERYNASAGNDQNVLNQVKDLFAKYMGGEQTGGTENDNTGDDDNDDTPPLDQTYTITYNANGGTGIMEQAIASTTAVNGFTAPLGNGFIEWNTASDGSGDSYAPGAEVSEDLTLYAIWGGTYRLGQEVTIGTGGNAQSFYVLIDEGISATDVTLLSKYNLDKNTDEATGKYYQKVDAKSEDTACMFSDLNISPTNYWAEEWYRTEAGVARRFDLNDEAKYGTSGEGSALSKAKSYATDTLDLNPNATGRLLTYEEANALKDSYGDMLLGRANKQGENSANYFLIYWLSSVSEYSGDEGSIWCVCGDTGNFNESDCIDNIRNAGVRPVVTVPKTAIAH